MRVYRRSDPVDRIPKYLIRRGDNECWGWTGHRTHDGYPTLCDFRTGKVVNVYVHVLSHKMHIGPVPEGYEVDHLCRNPECTNPRHLEAVTRVENLRRMRLPRDAVTGRFLARAS